MPERTGDPIDLDLKMRLAADRVLRAVTLRRQAKVAVLASAALSVAAAVRPDLLPPDLIMLKDLLNVGAISGLLRDVADGKEPDEEQIARRMEALLPPGQLDRLAAGQNDLLRALTRQHAWQQQMLRLQEADGEAGARLLAGMAEMTGDLAAIRDAVGAAATQEQLNDLARLIEDRVLPRLAAATREQYILSGDFRGGMVNINSTVTLAWPEGRPYVPPPPPAPGELPRPDRLPPGAFIPFDRNPLFTGRGDDLLALAAQLMPDTRYEIRDTKSGDPSSAAQSPATPAAGGRRSAVVSSGIGGVGKTQLAVEFAYRFGRFFHGVHWVSMDNPDAVDAAVAECGRRMRLHPAFGDLPLPDQAALTAGAWAGPEARLIIFDNCEKPELLARWRPKGGGAAVLVTSRNPVWPRSAGVAHRPLDTLPREQAVALLREYVGTAGDGRPATADLEAIAAELGDLPLALHLAGSYLESYAGDPQGTPAALLAELRDPALSLQSAALTGRGAAGSPTDHELHVANTFLLSARALERGAPDPALAAALLARAACFAPGEPVPAALLRATAGEATDSRDVSDGLRALAETGLLERAGDEAYRLHRLVARFAAAAAPPDELDAARAAVEGVVRSLLRVANNSRDPRSLRGLEVHLRHVVDLAAEREDETAASLCGALDYCFDMSGDLRSALPYSERALAIRERVLGPEHPDTASSLNNLGFLLQAMGDLPAARPYYERALAIYERVLGPEHPDTAISYGNLGSLVAALGDVVKGRSLLEQARDVFIARLGREHPYTREAQRRLDALPK